jgi:hypothetical protein
MLEVDNIIGVLWILKSPEAVNKELNSSVLDIDVYILVRINNNRKFIKDFTVYNRFYGL